MEIKKLFEHCRSGQTQKVLAMVRNISFMAVIFIMAIVGIYFMISIDLSLEIDQWFVSTLDKDQQLLSMEKSKSLCLMVAILLTFGSAALSASSEARKDQLWLVYLLKGLAVLSAVIFIVFVCNFETNYLVDTFTTDKTWVSYVEKLQSIKALSIVFTSLGITGILVNIASNVLLGVEE